jgi:hypothetical protein
MGQRRSCSRTRSVPGALWVLVDRGGTLGPVNLRDIAYIGDTYDATADRLLTLGERPSATWAKSPST